jgi:hypothetical protein
LWTVQRCTATPGQVASTAARRPDSRRSRTTAAAGVPRP